MLVVVCSWWSRACSLSCVPSEAGAPVHGHWILVHGQGCSFVSAGCLWWVLGACL